MKITFVLPYAGLQGGIRVIAIYAERLARRGHDVRVLSVPQVFTHRHTLKSLLLHRSLPRPEPSYFEDVDVPHRVLESVRPVTDDDVEDGDVVVATYYTTAYGVERLSASKGAKVLFIQNYEVEEGTRNPRLDATWRMPMHKIVISRWLVDLARERFGDDDVSHVPNSVDTTQFHAPPRGKGPVPTVGMLYSTFSLKGCRTSLKALRRAAEVVPDLRLIAFGAEPPDFRLPLPRFAEFHLRPPQAAIRALYARCDVWLCGSNVEGFHLPPLEAMACRCPVVSTRVGGPMDIVEEGVNGHLVDVKDDLALADRLVRVLRMGDADWRRMADAACRTAARFSWDDATLLFEAALLRARRWARADGGATRPSRLQAGADGSTAAARGPSSGWASTVTRPLLDAMMLAQRWDLRPPAAIARPLRRAARTMLTARAGVDRPQGWDRPLIPRRGPAAATAATAATAAATTAAERDGPGAPPPMAWPPSPSPAVTISCLLATSSLDVGGMDEVVAFLARRLARLGVRTTVLHAAESGSAKGMPAGRLGRALDSEGIRTVQLGADAGRRFIEQARPDVISAHDPPAWVLDAATRHAIPYVETLHGMHSLFDVDWAGEARRSTRIAGLVAVSDLVRQQYLRGNPGFPPDRIRTLPNGVDDERRVPGRRDEARERLGLADEFLFVSLARHCLQKNTYGLVDAFDDVAAAHPGAHLVIAGRPDDPAYFGQVTRLRSRLRHGDRVHLREHTDRPAELLAAADGFVLDSFFEGWALASMEALFAGVPVVLSEVGGAVEQVGADGRRGICVANPLGDPLAVSWDTIRTARFARQANREPLVRAMCSLVEDRALWLERRAALAAESARRFDPLACVRGHAQVLADAVDAARAGQPSSTRPRSEAPLAPEV